KTEHTETQHREKYEPDEAVVRPRPEKTGDEDGANDQHASHRRSSLLRPVQFCQPANLIRASNWLTDLEPNQFDDYGLPKDERENERRHGGRHGPERDIKEHVKADKLIAQSMKVEHHLRIPSIDCPLANSSSTRSVRAARLPFIITRSPGDSTSSSSCAASTAHATADGFGRPS